MPQFLPRYGEAAARLRAALEAFPPDDVRAWCAGLGEETFVGSSGRVFPKSFKASPLLRAWLRELGRSGVVFKPRHRWTGWSESGDLRFETPAGMADAGADAAVLALGGASWPRLGSDGAWADVLGGAGIAVTPLRAANCGFLVQWSDLFRDRFEGQPLKRIGLSFGGTSVRGEAIVTRQGLEGGGVYALSSPVRDAIAARGEAVLHITLRPDMNPDEVRSRLAVPRNKQSLATFLRKTLSLPPVAIALLHEAAPGRLAGMTVDELAALVNAVPVRLVGLAPLDRAISTAGGVAFDEIDDDFMLCRRPGVLVAGEMLDWEAPTGGYLLQASFSTGAATARGVLAWLARGSKAAKAE